MLIAKPRQIAPSEITPQEVYMRRREFLSGAAALGLANALPGAALAAEFDAVKSPLSTDEPPTSLKDITSYNNFYEFGIDKEDPARYAGKLTTSPWTVKVDGLVAKPADYALEDILKPVTIEERIYRLRCVDAWSMVVPWNGFPLVQ
jgi:sulfoxide reductase catalytic subunit YedY